MEREKFKLDEKIMNKRELLKVIEEKEIPVSYKVETCESFKEIQDEKISLENMIYILDKMSEVIIDNLPASINCEAFEQAEVLCFDRVKFLEVMKDDFELSKIIINSLAMKVRRLYRQGKNSIPIKVEKRVAAKLWKLSRDYGIEIKEGILIDLNITITYLADMFGAPRETISRALKILNNEGLIINKNKKIIITNRDKLVKFFKEN